MLKDKFKSAFYNCLPEHIAIEHICIALTNHKQEFRNLSEKYKANKRIARHAITLDNSNTQYISAELKQDHEIVNLAISMDATNINFINDKFKTDKQLALMLLQKNESVLKYLSEHLKANQEIVEWAVSKNATNIHLVNHQFKTDKQLAYPLLKQNHAVIEYLSDELKADPDIVKQAVSMNIENIHLVHEKFKTDKHHVLMLLHITNGLVLEHVSVELKDDIDVIKVAICRDPSCVNLVNPKFKTDRQLALELVKTNVDVLTHLSTEFQSDKEFLFIVITRWPAHMASIPETLLNDKEFILDALQKNKQCFLYLPKNMQQDEDILLAVIQQDASKYSKEYTLDTRDTIQFAIKAIFANKDVLAKLSATKTIHPQIKWLRRNIDNIDPEHKEYIKDTFLKYPNAFLYPDDIIKTLLLGTPEDYMIIAQYAIMKYDKTKNIQSDVDTDFTFTQD